MQNKTRKSIYNQNRKLIYGEGHSSKMFESNETVFKTKRKRWAHMPIIFD